MGLSGTQLITMFVLAVVGLISSVVGLIQFVYWVCKHLSWS